MKPSLRRCTACGRWLPQHTDWCPQHKAAASETRFAAAVAQPEHREFQALHSQPESTLEERAKPEWPEVEDILALLKRPERSGWRQGLLVFGLSLFLFAAAGLLGYRLIELALIIVVLLIHESGHYIGMRLFHYRNVQLFFIPFFGAAVSGQKARVPGYKEAIVILLGPLPGIFIGLVLGILSYNSFDSPMRSASEMFIMINGFNLLPFLPLDGGRFLQLSVFGRQKHLEALYTLITGALLVLMSWWLGAWLLFIVGAFIVFSTGHTFKVSSIAADLRPRLALGLAQDDNLEEIPRDAVLAIIRQIDVRMPQLKDAKQISLTVRTVWERMNVQPLGCLATLAFLGIYGFSLISAPLIYTLTNRDFSRHFAAGAGLPTYGYILSDDSMMPTLTRGDCFISVHTFETLERGEIVLYEIPSGGGAKGVKRVIGIPGDHVAYRDKAIYLNGQKVRQELAGSPSVRGAEGSVPGSLEFVEHLEGLERGGAFRIRHESPRDSEASRQATRPFRAIYIQTGEQLITIGQVYRILIAPEQESQNGQWIVGAGQYFLLGDNRDASFDSRYWGSLDESKIIGTLGLVNRDMGNCRQGEPLVVPP